MEANKSQCCIAALDNALYTLYNKNCAKRRHIVWYIVMIMIGTLVIGTLVLNPRHWFQQQKGLIYDTR